MRVRVCVCVCVELSFPLQTGAPIISLSFSSSVFLSRFLPLPLPARYPLFTPANYPCTAMGMCAFACAHAWHSASRWSDPVRSSSNNISAATSTRARVHVPDTFILLVSPQDRCKMLIRKSCFHTTGSSKLIPSWLQRTNIYQHIHCKLIKRKHCKGSCRSPHSDKHLSVKKYIKDSLFEFSRKERLDSFVFGLVFSVSCGWDQVHTLYMLFLMLGCFVPEKQKNTIWCCSLCHELSRWTNRTVN